VDRPQPNWANTYSHSGIDNPAGYNLGMWNFWILGCCLLSIVAAGAWSLRQGLPTVATEEGGISMANYQFPEVATLLSGWGLKLGITRCIQASEGKRLSGMGGWRIERDEGIRRTVEIL
jgi:hypothetical protein